VKIGLVDVQIKGLTELLKRKQEKNEHFYKLTLFPLRFAQPGGLMSVVVDLNRRE